MSRTARARASSWSSSATSASTPAIRASTSPMALSLACRSSSLLRSGCIENPRVVRQHRSSASCAVLTRLLGTDVPALPSERREASIQLGQAPQLLHCVGETDDRAIFRSGSEGLMGPGVIIGCLLRTQCRRSCPQLGPYCGCLGGQALRKLATWIGSREPRQRGIQLPKRRNLEQLRPEPLAGDGTPFCRRDHCAQDLSLRSGTKPSLGPRKGS